jgi:Sulfotransferase family
MISLLRCSYLTLAQRGSTKAEAVSLAYQQPKNVVPLAQFIEETPAMDRGPIFVAGIERSGTSLIYALLASHPNIAMTRRTNLWTFFYERYGDLGQPANLDRCLDTMAHYKRLTVLKLDFDRLRREFLQGETTYSRLFALLEEQCAERAGKPRWGDKSLNTERYVDDIFAAYPTARMLHMIRDPRDRYASALTRWKKIQGKVGAGTAIWLSSVGLAKQNQERYPDRYKIVRYELLASQPEETLRDICAFLNEEYSPAMLTMAGAPSHRDRGGNSSYGKREQGRISTSSIGRFRQVLSKRDIAFMQVHAKHDMADYGYQPEPIQFSLSDQLLFYLVDWPNNLARMIAWRTKEAIDNRKGRTMPAATLVAEAESRHA